MNSLAMGKNDKMDNGDIIPKISNKITLDTLALAKYFPIILGWTIFSITYAIIIPKKNQGSIEKE